MTADKFGMVIRLDDQPEKSNLSDKLSTIISEPTPAGHSIPPSLIEKVGNKAGFVNRDGNVRPKPRRYHPVADEYSVPLNLRIKESLNQSFRDLADELGDTYPVLLDRLIRHWRNTH